jgi:hypothetical protein
MSRKFGVATLALCGAAALVSVPAQALTINLIDADGSVTGTPAQQGFEIAAKYWESVLTNDAVVNFDVGFDHLGSTILGQTSSTLVTYVPINTYYSLLAATGNSQLDAEAVSHLQPLSSTGSVAPIVPNYSDPGAQTGVANSGTRIAPDGQPISNTMALTSANLKALIGTSDPSLNATIDGHITFSSDFAFDFNPTNGIDNDKYDFIGVAIHEMGHALGFVTGAQDFDYSTPNAGAGQGFPTDQYWWSYAGDMFRYTGTGDLNWAFNQPSYFSIDGGATAFNGNAYYSTGEVNGDGYQASHWLAPTNAQGKYICNNNFVGIMNPYTCNGQVDKVTDNDIGYFDAIGWNTNVDALGNPGYSFTTAQAYAAWAPEPGTWAELVVGFGFVGGATRSIRRRKALAA